MLAGAVAPSHGAVAQQASESALPLPLPLASPSAPELLRTPAGALAGSLLVPGSAQLALGLKRWPLYLVAEAGLWWMFADARADHSRLTRGYRDLAWDVARQPGSFPREDGSWGYYETMGQYLRSGAWDAATEPGLQPEEDESTYNGYVWGLARAIYLPGGAADPESELYAAALQYYTSRAAGPAYLWSWQDHEAEMERFRDLIAEADDESRTSTTALGLILANHVVSAIDALLVSRIRSGADPSLESSIEASSGRPRLNVGIRLHLIPMQ